MNSSHICRFSIYTTSVAGTRAQSFTKLGQMVLHFALPAVAVLAFTSSVSASQIKFLYEFGTFGNGNGEFASTRGLAVNETTGNLYVADGRNRPDDVPYLRNMRIQVLDTQGNYQFQFSSEGDGLGDLRNPWDVALDDSGNVYVAEEGNHRISVFDSTGQPLFNFGSRGSQIGQFQDPIAVAVGNNGNIYVADSDNDRVQVFDGSGRFLFSLGGVYRGTSPGQFWGPSGVAVSDDGLLYVADSSNRRIQVFDRETGVFKFLFSTLETRGPGPLALDNDGNLYVGVGNAFRVFDRSGTYLYEFLRDGVYGRLHVDSDYKIYIPNGHKVSVYQIVPEPSSLLLSTGMAIAALASLRRRRNV